MAREASSAFVEECIRMGTLDHVLASLGWSKKQKTHEWVPPAYVAHQSLKLNEQNFRS
jgi:hypothetical protein